MDVPNQGTDSGVGSRDLSIEHYLIATQAFTLFEYQLFHPHIAGFTELCHVPYKLYD
jgi:hypothetical protein